MDWRNGSLLRLEIADTVYDLRRARSAADEIAAVDDEVSTNRLEIDDDGVESRQVGVDIRDNGNAHDRS